MTGKRFFLAGTVLFLAATAPVVNCQTYEDMIRQEQEEFSDELLEETFAFHAEQKRDFQEFRDERDRDFAEFLKAQWEQVDFEEPLDIVEKPKPPDVPVAKLPPVADRKKPPVQATAIPPDKVVKVEAPPAYVPPPRPVPPVDEARPSALQGQPVTFDFYGTNVSMRYDPAMRIDLARPIDNNAISTFWAALARSDFNLLLKQAFAHRERFQLNDWGYYVFLDRLAEQIEGARNNEKHLLVWFMLTKSGYEAKVGYRRDGVVLFMPATTNLYGVSFYTLEGRRYYAVSATRSPGSLGKIMTYKGSYPGAERNMDFLLREYPHIKGQLAAKDLSFQFKGRRHSVRVEFNRNSIPYFEYHPQTDVSLYAMAPMPDWMGGSLLPGLRPLLDGLSEQEQVNLLLRFTQTAFQYKTDQQQFGREKVMFPEEMVYYPYSDCEDRSIFFSYLVRKLMGLEVVLLSYPNHIATAVRLHGKAVGDQVVVGGTAYTICDPTYINAELGMAMPQFKGVTPQVVVI